MNLAPLPDLDQAGQPIAAQVARTLRLAIVNLQLSPGERLSEQDVATHFGISRQPVREAFIKLKEAGLLRILPQRSTVVVKISCAAVENARFLRESVECALAREAAQRGYQCYEIVLKNLDSQRSTARARDAERFFPLDEEFHSLLAEAAGRPRVWRLMADLKPLMDRVGYLVMGQTTMIQVLADQHGRIAASINAHDPDAAETAMRAHLREILEPLPELVKRHPNLFEE